MLDIDAVLLEGIGHQQAGRFTPAEAAYREVLEVQPDHPRALYLCGLLYLRDGRPGEAVRLFLALLNADPAHRGGRINFCRALVAAKRFASALDATACALRLLPETGELHFLRGTTLNGLGRPAEASLSLRRAVALAPDLAQAWLNLGNACAELDRLDEAEQHIREALRLAPDLAEAWTSLGFVLTSLGRLEEGRAACMEGVRLQPDFAQAHWNLAAAALLQGDFATGFREYEWRKRHDRFRPFFRDRAGPAWTGEPLEGRDLLIHAEQGLGDTIQLSRFAPLLAERGARMTLACDRRLIRLLAGAPALHRVVDRVAEPPNHDFWVDQMSLPGLLGTMPETIPAPEGWLQAEAAGVSRFAACLPPGRRAGLVWAGNPCHSNDARRSLPERFLPSLIDAGRAAGLSWISAQIGPRAAEAARHGLYDAAPYIADFADSAALLGALDLVVCVDTSIAHLAGALGKPAFVMLPYAPDWRWMLGRDDTPWYSSLRLFRQERPGDWDSVIARLARALQGV